MKIPQREIPLVNFRRDLPEYLAGGVPCWIEIDGRAAGYINTAFVAGRDAIKRKAMILDRKRTALEPDAEAYVDARLRDPETIAKDRFALLHDACVIAWRTNIQDDGKPAECTRENFLALAEVHEPAISAAIMAFERECLAAGLEVVKEQDATVKN